MNEQNMRFMFYSHEWTWEQIIEAVKGHTKCSISSSFNTSDFDYGCIGGFLWKEW